MSTADDLAAQLKWWHLPQTRLGHENREAVRWFFSQHLGCTHRECGKALGISAEAVGRHVKAIRKEWVEE